MGVFRFALKSTLLGGVVYYTIEEGLWSSSEESIKFYNNVYNLTAPYVKSNIPEDVVKELPTLPSVTNMTDCSKAMWNKGVMASIKFISELPDHVSPGMNRISATMKSYVDQLTMSEKVE